MAPVAPLSTLLVTSQLVHLTSFTPTLQPVATPLATPLNCSQAAVRKREGETDWFEVKCGLRQGGVLSLLLFIIFMYNIMKRANQEENSIEELTFADDLVLIAEDQIRRQEMVSNIGQQCKKYGMRISRDKTEVMVTSREPIQCDIEIDGETHMLSNSST